MSEEGFVIRRRFWPLWLWWSVAFQTAWMVFLVTGLASRAADGQLSVHRDEMIDWTAQSAFAALFALLIALRRRNIGRADIFPNGIRPFRSDRVVGWDEVETVRVHASLFGRRWLSVWPEQGKMFVLPERPADPHGALEAVERFAGPLHPLTRALANAARESGE